MLKKVTEKIKYFFLLLFLKDKTVRHKTYGNGPKTNGFVRILMPSTEMQRSDVS